MGKSKVEIAKLLNVRRPTIVAWLKRETYQDERGWKAGKHRKYSEEINQRIRELKQKRIDHNYFVGSDHVRKDYAIQNPSSILPTESHIDAVVRRAGLQTKKPKERRKGSAQYLLFPDQCIRSLGYVQQSADFIGKKYITGRTEPINIFSTSYYFPFKLYQIKRVVAEKVDYALAELIALWRTYPIPNVFRIDNGLQFRGGAAKRSIGRFLKFLLNLRVTPLFGAPRKPWTNPHVEGHNRVFNEKVWNRNFFTSPEHIDQECGRFNQESLELLRYKYAELIFHGPFRYLERGQVINTETLSTVKGKKAYFIRFVESSEAMGGAYIIVMNETVAIPESYTHQFVFAEWDLEKELLNIYSEYQKVSTLIHQVKFCLNI